MIETTSKDSCDRNSVFLRTPIAKRRRISFAYETIAVPFSISSSGVLGGREISCFKTDSFTCLNGVVYQNDVAYTGQATIAHPNGSLYTGNFQDGLPQGQCILTSRDGMTVKGIAEGFFQNEAFQGAITDENDLIYSYKEGTPLLGNYTISWNNGVSYKGDFQDGLPHGRGVIYYEDGSGYEGEFKSGKPHGRGKMSYSDGSIDVGEFRNGYSDGECTRRHETGDIYNGKMEQGEPSGYGTWYFSDGGKYEGEFVQGRFCGKGKMTFTGGTQIQGEFVNDALISSNSAEMGDAQFILELFGLPGGSGNLDGSSLGIMVDFLKQNGYAEDAEPLIEVYERMKVVKLQEEAKKIHAGILNEKKPWLLLYGTLFHSMALNLVPKEDSVIFEFFNSGEGLDYHLSNGKKYQTMLQVKIPKNVLTEDMIWELLMANKFQKSIENVYKFILQLPGVVNLEQNTPVWQVPQCENNCGIEWIFAYLINKMPRQRYNEMRLKLCEMAIARAKLNPDPKTQELLKENEKIISEKLERKRKRVLQHLFS